MIATTRNQQHGSKSTQLQPTDVTSQFELAEESLFPERSVRVLREAKNVNVCGIFDLR